MNYRTDLAYIHDAGFSGYVLDAAPGILRHLREHDAARGLVIDLGCGSGVLARQLAFAGYDVLGIDHSAAMIRIARTRAPKSRFRTASLLNVRLPQCAAVLCVGEVLSYAYSHPGGLEALSDLFVRVWNALLPGGIFLVDFGQTGRLPGGMPRKGFWTGQDWAVLLEVLACSEDLILRRRLTTFRKIGPAWRRREELHTLRLFDATCICQRLKTAGFEARLLRSLGALRFRSGHGGALAIRPAAASGEVC